MVANSEPEISFGTSNKKQPIIMHENDIFKCNRTTDSRKIACVINEGVV